MKEPIICIVGFLGSGKTSLLKSLTTQAVNIGLAPYVILNDYENAYLDLQQFQDNIPNDQLKALNGSCICCSGITQLRDFVNRIPERENGITFIEANGTSDACSLMEFLGVGINERFLPPVQISVVDVSNWQKRETHNSLEANQIQVSSLLVLTHVDKVDAERKDEVISQLKKLNPYAEIVSKEAVDVNLLQGLVPSTSKYDKMDHHKSHWSSASVDLPELIDKDDITRICDAIPNTVLRVKGCCKIQGEEAYTYFERTSYKEIVIRPFRGVPITGTKILCIGSGSSKDILEKAISQRYIQKDF